MSLGNVLNETADEITITRKVHFGFRLFLILLSFIPLVGVYEMLIKPHWNLGAVTMMNIWMLGIPLIIGIGSLGMFFTVLAAATMGADESFVFDKRYRRFTYKSSKRPLVPAVHYEFSYAELPPPRVVLDNNNDGPNTWDVVMDIPGLKRPRVLYTYTAKEPAEALAARLMN